MIRSARLTPTPTSSSGGQRQRVLIAMALTRDPKLIIADEPTTALDVTVQKQVIDLLNKLQKELGFAMVFVSHDLALVAEVANSITVMYAGQVVEQGPVHGHPAPTPSTSTRAACWARCCPSRPAAPACTRCPAPCPRPKDFPEGDRFAPRSSHPDQRSRMLRPVLKRVEGHRTTSARAELPDERV